VKAENLCVAWIKKKILTDMGYPYDEEDAQPQQPEQPQQIPPELQQMANLQQ